MCLSAIFWVRFDKTFSANLRQGTTLIGFDDDFLYHEVVTSIEKRTLLTQQLFADDVIWAFQVWINKANKIPY